MLLRILIPLFLILVLSSCALQRGKKISEPVAQMSAIRGPEFRQETSTLLGQGYVPGNNIVTLVNGDEIFPAMLQAIRSAKRTINFETYVFWDSDIGKAFADALAERAAAGVQVHAVLDAQGTHKMGLENVSRMRRAGVDVQKYHTAFWWDLRRYNNRTHRKLLIVDGKVGFIGGVGIAREWEGNAESPEHWRDNHYRVTGPVVAQLQAIFMENWLKTRGTLLNGPDYFPPLTPTGPYLAQAFASSPQYGNIGVHLLYLLTIASARNNLRIENAYFLPDKMTRDELIAAAKRGVNVEIVVPGKYIDQKLVRRASQHYWPELLCAGVKLYEYEPTMVHVKLMIVDDLFVSVGSANFDNRSIRLNDEANLNVLSRKFAAEQTHLFELDKANSQPASLDKRGHVILGKPMQAAAGAVAPEL